MSDANGKQRQQVPCDAHSPQAVGETANQHWWPDNLNLRILRQNNPLANPMGDDFDYAAEFNSLDFDELVADIDALMTDSQDWWPADYGHYGPLFIRMTWHAARGPIELPGRPGWRRDPAPSASRRSQQLARQREPGSRPAGCSGPSRQKYGRKISWADLHDPGRKQSRWSRWACTTFGFGGGREDVWAARGGHLLGSRGRSGSKTSATAATASWPTHLGAVQMGLIYVNPEGPNGNPDPARRGHAIFARRSPAWP